MGCRRTTCRRDEYYEFGKGERDEKSEAHYIRGRFAARVQRGTRPVLAGVRRRPRARSSDLRVRITRKRDGKSERLEPVLEGTYGVQIAA